MSITIHQTKSYLYIPDSNKLKSTDATDFTETHTTLVLAVRTSLPPRIASITRNFIRTPNPQNSQKQLPPKWRESEATRNSVNSVLSM